MTTASSTPMAGRVPEPLSRSASAAVASLAVDSVRERLRSIDAVRGLAIVLMALDHVRYFFPLRGVVIDPTDLRWATASVFLSRWITHICAPIFVTLAGVGTYLSLRHQKTSDVGAYLIKRGFWLLLLELTLVNFSFTFQLRPPVIVGQVLWAIGWAFIGLAAVLKLRPRIVGWLGVLLLALQAPAWAFAQAHLSPSFAWLAVLWTGERFPLSDTLVFSPKYPIMPWLGVIMVGYGLGPLYLQAPARRRRNLLMGGLVLVLAFLLLRALDVPFDASWIRENTSDPRSAILSFLNCEKYPPSVLFFLMTLGPTLLLLALFERVPSRWAEPLVNFGKAPMLFYLLHIPMAHILFLTCDFIRTHPPVSVLFPEDEWGFVLPLVFLIWGVLVVGLYPLCRRFAEVKGAHKCTWWARYL